MFQKFPSINQFREVKRNVEWDAQYRGDDADGQPILDRTASLPTLGYTGTVKLHGTNAAINYQNGTFTCQSRENEITPEKDNAGFARWVNGLPASVHEILRGAYPKADELVIFGEWCGGNIQPGVAIAGLPKMFVVFAVQVVTNDENNEAWCDLVVLPELEKHGIYESRQFGVWDIDIDFEKPARAIEKMNELTLQIEKQCPAGKFFGREGVGEGLVWTPNQYSKKRSRLVFKTKGSEHSKTKVKKLAAVNPEKVESARVFAEKHVHNERLEQAYAWLAQAGHPQNEKATGYFVKRVVDDVVKEEGDELAFNGMNEKDVSGIMSTIARKWFFGRFNR